MLVLIDDSALEKEIESRMKRKLVAGGLFVLIAVVFLYAFIGDAPWQSSSSSSLTGFVVLDSGIKVSTEKLDSSLVQAIQAGDMSPRVIVVLDSSGMTIGATEQSVITNLDSSLDVGVDGDAQTSIVVAADNSAVGERGTAGEINDIRVTHAFDTVSALSMEVQSPEALLALANNKKVTRILLDYPVQLSLDDSVPLMKANKVWNLSSPLLFGNGSENRNITGFGNSVCVIDTGVDYSHRALGDCDIVSYNTSGLIENISLVESVHPYANSFDYTWKIQKEGYSSIALHFRNISLESQTSGDTTDRVYVYDSNNNTIGVYKGELRDVWTEHALGDTLYVRLTSDSSLNSFGFVVDSVINGTTNSTMHWENCPVVVGGYDTYNGDSDPMDDHGHGTHVAGIIASQNDTYRGVAPGAHIVALKALSATGSGYSSDVLSALEWCNQNAAALNISVISMSLGCDGAGCPHYGGYCDNDLLSDVINRSTAKNISVVIASGNSGWSDGISNPSCIQNAIPIGGETMSSGIVFNRGGVLQIIAPGVNVRSSVPGNSWATWSGTSMATPHAAGTIALMQQYSRGVYGRILTPQEIESRLAGTPLKMYDTASLKNYTLLDAYSATVPIVVVTNMSIGITGENVSINVNSSEPIMNVSVVLAGANVSSIFNTSSGNNTAIKFSIPLESQGIFWYSVQYRDVAGNLFASKNYSIVSESASLGLTVVTPVNNTFVRSEINLSGMASMHNQTRVNISLIGPLVNGSRHNLSLVNGSVANGSVVVGGNVSRLYSMLGNDTQNITFSSIVSVRGFMEGNYSMLNSLEDSELMKLEHRKIVIDSTAPQLMVVSMVVNSSNVSIHVNASDLYLDSVVVEKLSTISGPVNFSMSLIGPHQYVFSFYSVPGTHNFTVYAQDKSRNTNVTIGSYTVDQAESMISMINPIENATFGIGEVVGVDAIVNTSSIYSYVIDWGDNSSVENTSNTSIMHAEKIYTAVGNYTLIMVINGSGVAGNVSRTIQVRDIRAPVVLLSGIANPLHTARDTQIEFEITDSSDIAAEEVRVDNTAFASTCEKTVGLWTCSATLPRMTAGNHEFSFAVADTFKNENLTTLLVAVQTCSDTVLNGDEVGSDCGGSCAPCATSTPVAIQQEMPAPVLAAPIVGDNATSPTTLSSLNLTDDTHVASSRAKTQQNLLYVLVFVIAVLIFLYAIMYTP